MAEKERLLVDEIDNNNNNNNNNNNQSLMDLVVTYKNRKIAIEKINEKFGLSNVTIKLKLNSFYGVQGDKIK